MADSARRSLAKTLSWRVIATLTTTIIAFLFLGDITVSTALAIALNIIKGAIYFFHERIWEKADWGKSNS
ncbi:MAG: DUF2061 domain-containing protein [Candidatus Bathyarchaeota archaeon]|nr:MAG: DUF2061 domain-containing protein [Candidatus Bathyarchaeota archaeon]